MNKLFRSKQHLLTAGILLVVSACSTMPDKGESYAPPAAAPLASVPASSGAIYQAGVDLRLFEDLKAARVGDILTIRLVEQTAASKNSATSTAKATEATLANPTLFGRAPTKGGVPLFEGSLSGDSTFDGAGSSSQSNSLVGDITVTVVERFPNGNLRIRGEKWVTLNQGKEFIQLSGIIRPFDIEPDNSILSSKVADAQIAYSSKGVLASANKMGLIARFFNSVFHPY